MSASVISNSPTPIDRPVATFTAYDLATGAPVVVDARTFDAARDSLEPPASAVA
jgi:hypothetical protein